MADSKITALTSISTSTDPANDPLVIVDVSDTSMAATGTTKKVTLNQLLGASGTATLASATITGDLTVDTSTLKVDSALNKVGVGVATLTGLQTFNVAGDVGITSDLVLKNSGGTVQGYIFGSSGLNYRVIAGQPHVWQEGGSDLMRLNSTGLGVGASPTQKFVCAGPRSYFAGGGAVYGIGIGFNTTRTAADHVFFLGATDSATPDLVFSAASGAELMRLNATGNVGIGITPSAGGSNYYKTLEIGKAGCGLFAATASLTGSEFTYLSGNGVLAYNAGAEWKYGNNGAAAIYGIEDGVHKWYNATTGTAGVVFTPTQAMTLTAAGDFLTGGKTAASVTAIGFQTLANGESSTAMASSTGSATVWNVYSTGAAAYRFYVGMNGTISATNTTISAISDARLKENVQDIDVGLGAILALKPRKFDWKEGKGKNIKGDRGFIAQEFEQVFPNLIDEWKDPAPEGEAPYKSVRQDLIPVLVKAIQELTARVQTLETR